MYLLRAKTAATKDLECSLAARNIIRTECSLTLALVTPKHGCLPTDPLYFSDVQPSVVLTITGMIVFHGVGPHCVHTVHGTVDQAIDSDFIST